MGTSTDAIIAFGIVFEEYFEFPWSQDSDDLDDVEDFGDYTNWWQKENGYKNPYTYEDNPDEWINHSIEWDKKNPIPFQEENYCSDECPMYALVIPKSIIRASRGHPESLELSKFNVDEKELLNFMNFLKKYNIEITEQPKWLLFSYWG